jgi:hypothetical protein
VIRIDVLPDDVLLQILGFYVGVRVVPSLSGKPRVEEWQSLIHVCRRWRNLVFQSPRRLNLRLFCTPKTPARDKLDIWPALPLIVAGNMALSSGTDNVIAGLGQSNRVCEVNLDLAGSQVEEVLAAMQVPFPELTDLRLFSDDETPVIPDSFLGGSAPRLRDFTLSGIPFPGLPKLLLSATHLVGLHLPKLPHSGYISPELMVALLSALSSLETLVLKFQSPQSRPDWETRRPPPLKRSVIPALTCFYFKGAIEYLEDLVTFIDVPQLDYFYITFFNPIDFDAPRLAEFVSRTPTLTAGDEARVLFEDSSASVALRARSWTRVLEIGISCGEPDLQLSCVARVCNSSMSPPFTIEDLYIEHEYWEVVWENDAIENTPWLVLLLPFTTVKNLYLCKEFAPGIAAALQELVGAGLTGVLPGLQNIFVEGLGSWGPFQENIGQFAGARRHSGHPIDISVWDKDPDTESM